jgi:hypothetical protein
MRSPVSRRALGECNAITRKALRDGEDGFQYIETVPRYGYRFIAEVRELGGIATDAAVLSDSTPSQPPFPVVPESRRLHHRLRGPAFVIAALVVLLAVLALTLAAGKRLRSFGPEPIQSLATALWKDPCCAQANRSGGSGDSRSTVFV